MNNAFNWVASAVNFSRFYYRTWPLVMLAPVSPLAICVGNIAAGIARGLIATALVAAVGLAAGWRPEPTPVFLLTLLLEMACFSALGMLIGVRTKTSEEHMAYTNFLITPMGFFCGTFFPLDNLPYGVFSIGEGPRRCGVAIGDAILDATALEAAGVLRLTSAQVL